MPADAARLGLYVWQRGLDGVAALAPEHLSLYVLEVEGRTLLTHRARSGALDLPDDDLVEEALFTGLRRRDGIDLVAFRAAHGVDVLADYARGLSAPFAAGLLERSGSHLRLTERGVLLSNEVFQAFV